MHQKFNVTGMTCSACSANVDRSVRKLEGVADVNVNLLSNSMTVDFDENLLDASRIIAAVSNAGYGASVFSKDASRAVPAAARENTAQAEIREMKTRIIVSAAFLVPLLYIAMFHMLKDWIGLPVPAFIHNTFHGPENGITFAFTQLLLLLPIVYVNRKYFITGFKTLAKRAPNMDSLIAIGSSAAIVYGISSRREQS